MSTALLHLMHLVSPALPVGAYAYSQGLESAIDMGWLNTDDELKDWLTSVLMEGVARTDAPAFLRCHRAIKAQRWQEVAEWNQWLLACRETRELLLEDQQLGIALQRLLLSLDVPHAKHTAYGPNPAFAPQFALACVHWDIPERDAVYGLCWSWLENQIGAATKVVPLGQTHAQKLLLELMAHIPLACDIAFNIDEDDMGISLPGVAMASARHEHQYSRLFRS